MSRSENGNWRSQGSPLQGSDVSLDDHTVDLSASSRFRFTASFIFLTYKFHIDKEYIREHFSRDVKDIWIAHETGDTNYDDFGNGQPYPHTHVLIEYSKRKDISSPRHWDLIWHDSTVHPHIRKPDPRKKKSDNLKNIKRYMSKEDPDCASRFSYEEGNMAKVQQYSTVWNMLNNADMKLNKPIDYLTLWNYRDNGRYIPCKITNSNDLLHWQFRLWNYLMGTVHDRHVVWIVDVEGGAGKSEFCKFMKKQYNSILADQAPGNYHFATILQNEISKSDSHILLIDLPRNQQNRSGIYEGIEKCKDGWINSVKYSGSYIPLGSMHVLVFSNDFPSYHMMSIDRWIILEVFPDGSFRNFRVFKSNDPSISSHSSSYVTENAVENPYDFPVELSYSLV